MENKDMIDMILDEIEEGKAKLLSDDKRRELMVNSIRKYNEVLEKRVEYLEKELNEDEELEKPEKVEDKKEDAGKTSYKELAKSRNIRKNYN